MKIGFCMLLWTTSLDESHRRLLEDIRATGYDGVEVPVFGGTPDDYARVGRMLDAIGLERTAISVMPPGADALSADPAERRAAVERLAWAADCAAALGATCVGGPLHQVLGQFSGAGPTEAEFERMRERPPRRRRGRGGARASPSRSRRSTGSRATSPTPWTTSAPTSPRSAIRRSR